MFIGKKSQCLRPGSKKMAVRLSFVARCVLAVAVFALTALPARGVDFTWDGNFDDEWDRNSGSPGYRTNWDPQGMNNPIPVGNDNVFFHGDMPYRTAIDLDGDRRVLSATFSGGYDYTLGTGVGFDADTLTLVTGNITAFGGKSYTIPGSVVLEADGDWYINHVNTKFYVEGRLSGVGGSAFALKKTGSGTLKLIGGTYANPSKLYSLRSENGEVVLDAVPIELTSTDWSGTTGALLARGGDITIEGGADVEMATGSWGLAENSTITITGIGSSLTGNRLDAAEWSNDTGSILVKQSASLDLDGELFIGFLGDGELTVQSGATASADWVVLGAKDAGSGVAVVTGANSRLSSSYLHLGGQTEASVGDTGTLTVEDGGAVEVANETKFWDPCSNSSMIINGGTFKTNKLTNHTGVVATVTITDPCGGVALTVGTNNGNSTWDGEINGPGTLNKVGTGRFTLTGKNYLTGTTKIDGGTIIIDHARALHNSTVSINVNDGLDVTNIVNPKIGALAGTGNLNLGSRSLTVGLGISNRTTTYSGIISGTGKLTKDGTSVLTLTGANTYTGRTTIDGGTLLANNSTGSATGNGEVWVNSGGTLGGNGNVGDAIIVNSGGTVAPGTSAGELAVDSVTFMSDSTFAVELGGLSAGSGYDVLIVDGTASLGGTLSLSYVNGFTASPGDSFVILPPVGSVVGEFDTVNYPDGQNWSIEYDYDLDKVTVGLCPDGDGDGVCDVDDICPGSDDNVDTDDDGVPNGCDICSGFDDSVDCNGNGIPDGCEYGDHDLTTTFAGGNARHGNMFDLTVTNPKGITITSFDGHFEDGTTSVNVKVWYVTDHTSYVGKNTGENLWTLLGSATLSTINPEGTPTPVPIGGLRLNYGETVGIYFTTLGGAQIKYTNGPLGSFSNGGLVFEDRGLGVVYPFGTIYEPRIWNGTIYYDLGDDCNNNEVPDDCDPDDDGDGVPDDCDVLSGCNDNANLYLDDIINLFDFAVFADDYGCSSGCTADIDGDGDTDFDDLLIIIANWLCAD